jgi:hypothetical protein
MLALIHGNAHLSDRVISRDYNKSLEDADTGSTY